MFSVRPVDKSRGVGAFVSRGVSAKDQRKAVRL